MKSRFCQIMNWADGSVGQMTSGEHSWKDSMPVTGHQFAHVLDDLGNRKTAGWGRDHGCIPNFGTDPATQPARPLRR